MRGRDGRVVYGARLESVLGLTPLGGSNPPLSANPRHIPLGFDSNGRACARKQSIYAI